MIQVVAYGEPQPAGSKSAFVPTNPKNGQPYRDKNGRIICNVVDAAKGSKEWKKLVRKAAQEQFDGDGPVTEVPEEWWLAPKQPLLVPCRVTMRIYRRRPTTHYRQAKSGPPLKPNAPRFHTQAPDALKLARAVEDALSAVIYWDDSQIVEEHIFKLWEHREEHGGKPRVEIDLEFLDPPYTVVRREAATQAALAV